MLFVFFLCVFFFVLFFSNRNNGRRKYFKQYFGTRKRNWQVSHRVRLNSSIDHLSRQSSPDRDIQSQIRALANEVKTTFMFFSDSYQGRLDRVTERLSDLQRQIGNTENRNTNNMTSGVSISQDLLSDRSAAQNDLHAQGEAALTHTHMKMHILRSNLSFMMG